MNKSHSANLKIILEKNKKQDYCVKIREPREGGSKKKGGGGRGIVPYNMDRTQFEDDLSTALNENLISVFKMKQVDIDNNEDMG